MQTRSLTRSLAVLGVALALAACGGTASPSPQSGGGGAAAASPAENGSTDPTGAGGPEGYGGTLTSSGVYSATWAAAKGLAADPFNSVSNPTLTSDKGTFGNIRVELDGKVSFGSGAPELTMNGSYDGTGATVTLDPGGQFVCAFTLDADLKGTSDGAVLRLSGSMTVHWHPEGLGGLNCP